ncbi:IS256 family transposase [Nitrospira sp. Kam-Ns4a]
MRARIREVIVTLVEGELTETLAALPSPRTEGRRGDRHGSEPRTITTGLGAATVELPRGRLRQDGRWGEGQRPRLPRDERRARAVDEAGLGASRTGATQRRITGALAPLLRGAPLSKRALSRLVGRMKSLVEPWRQRPLTAARCVALDLDAVARRVRLAQQGVTASVWVALGVRADGQQGGLDLERLTSEATPAWQGLLEGLAARGLRQPRLCVIDGHPGLRAAVEATWPGVAGPRSPVHTLPGTRLAGVERHAPTQAVEEIRTDSHAIVSAETLHAARHASRALLSQWRARAPKVAASLEEAGEDLLTCSRFPRSQGKSRRTTHAMERFHGEFRRRVKTQGAWPTAQAAARRLFGLILSGQIRRRRIDGWRDLAAVEEAPQAA